MASEVIKLNLIPKGEMPVFHASQFDTGRLITCELYRGEDAYDVPAGYTVELHCRKVDNNIVTMASTLINGNVVTFTSTEQLTACNGKNLCEVAILDEGYRIGTLNFILEVEIDPLKGGINSTSEIHNLETQVEEITTEIIGENYYNKTEVDDLLDTKADASSVYTKTETDTKLALKANASDVYTKSQTDTLLSAKADSDYVNTQLNILDDSIDDLADVVAGKANSSDVYTKAQVESALALKANAADVYTKQEVDNIIMDIMPVDTASGPIAAFNTELAAPLVNVSCDVVATGGNGTPGNPIPINGYTEANITANGDVITIAFGQTVYGGVLDVTRGKLHVTHGFADMGNLSWTYEPATATIPFGLFRALPRPKPILSGDIKSSCYLGVIKVTSALNNLECAITGTTAYPWVRVRDDAYTDAISFTASVTGQNIVYELATPFDIDLTPKVISAVVGTNNVYSDTNGDTTVKFKDSIQHYIDNH